MSDQMTISDGKVTVVTQEGRRIELPEGDLVQMVEQSVLPPLNGAALPDGLKFPLRWHPPYMLAIHQSAPQVAEDSPEDYGAKTKYRSVTLSIPYTIVFAMFQFNGGGFELTKCTELYFSNRPIRSTRDKLAFPALLNISRVRSRKRLKSWICTQHLKSRENRDWTAILNALLEHVWCGAFNKSSEHHEGASWYGESEGVDKNLHPVEKWEKATQKNHTFALSVDWKASPLNVGQIANAMFEEMLGRREAELEDPDCALKVQSLVSRFINYAVQKKGGQANV